MSSSRILFDASSTNPISELIAVAAGDCVQINAWNLAVGEVAQVYRALMELGSIPAAPGGSCLPPPGVTGAQMLTEAPYFPCNVPVEVGQETNLNITTLVLQQPGYYRLYLTPSALGTAFVEAVVLTHEECESASRECCCTPETWWEGISLNPCLVITPGGNAGHAPIFSLDACCLLQSITNVQVPQLSDEILFISGGTCARATIDSLFSNVVLCDSLQELAPGAFDPAANMVQVALGGCALVSNATLLCDMLQALPSCTCEPTPGDLVPIIQGGACVLAAWPTVDLCDQIAALAPGVLVVGDTVPVREAGGNCKQVLASSLGASFPLLAPNGSCLAPSYSFTASPDSGMFYDPAGVGKVVIGDDNCADFISVGASIRIVSTISSIEILALAAGVGSFQIQADQVGSIRADNLLSLDSTSQINVGSTFTTPLVRVDGDFVLVQSVGGGTIINSTAASIVVDSFTADVDVRAANQFLLSTNSVLRLSVVASGAWEIGGTAGVAGQVITSAGPGLPPVWAAATATVTFPLLAPTTITPQYSFTACPAAGMAFDPVNSEVFFGVSDASTAATSSGLRIRCASPNDMFLEGRDLAAGARGANIEMSAGGGTAGVVNGGELDITGGDSAGGAGGRLELFGGDSGAVNGVGGDLNISSGSGGEQPGNVNITGGAGTVGNYLLGGNVNISVASGGNPALGVKTVFKVEVNGATLLELNERPQFENLLRGSTGTTFQTAGGNLRVAGGTGLAAGGNGGDLFLAGGAPTGGPTMGGRLSVKGGGSGGGGAYGYAQWDMTGTAPVAGPSTLAGATPMIFFNSGGVLRLYAWDDTLGSWKSVLFA